MDTNSPIQKTGALSSILPWIQAARPAALPMILAPLLIGQALAFGISGQFRWVFFFGTLAFGIVYQIFLLYLNDFTDAAIDKTNAQYWLSGGSRVVPQGKLQPHGLLKGARIASVVLCGIALILAAFLERPWMLLGVALAVVLCWAYNLRPLRASYRGGGEILQGLGCGVLLPLIGFYMQQGSLQGFAWAALITLYLLFHAGNIITALPDYASDKIGGKNTFPVRHGELRARQTALLLLAVAYANVLVASPNLSPISLAIIVIPSGVILFGIVRSGVLRQADVAEFSMCKQFVTLVSASQAWLLCAWIGALLVDGAA